MYASVKLAKWVGTPSFRRYFLYFGHRELTGDFHNMSVAQRLHADLQVLVWFTGIVYFWSVNHWFDSTAGVLTGLPAVP